MKEKARDDMARARPRAIYMTLMYLLMLGALSLILNRVSGGVYMTGRLADPGLIWLKFLFQILAGLFQSILMVGFLNYSLSAIERKPASFSALFGGFRDLGRVLWLTVLMGLFTVLWTLLLVVPGILAVYRYRMAYFLIIENPDMTAMEAIRLSKRLMAGRKTDLFLLDLSFVGWALPAVPLSFAFWRIPVISSPGTTAGVYGVMLAAYCVGLWLVPYFNFTNAVFYQNAVKEGEKQAPAPR